MRSEEEMRAVFSRFGESGLTLKAFGEREGISYTTLQYWRRKLNGKKPGRKPLDKPVTLPLTQVRVVPDASAVPSEPKHFEVWFSNGVSVEIPEGFDELELRRLVGVLSTC